MPEAVGSDRPTARFVGVTYAGWAMRQRRLRENVIADGRLDASFDDVTGWVEGGLIESLPVPHHHRGLARAAWQSRHLISPRRPDVLWTSSMRFLGPYRTGPLGRAPWPPLIAELDWTVEQKEEMAPWYYEREGRTAERLERSLAKERASFRHVSLFVPWTNWAADGLRRQGIPDDRIQVIHPGLRLDDWAFHQRQTPVDRPIRLLFVGGDFERKGGDLLLQAMERFEPGRFELDIVTPHPVTPHPVTPYPVTPEPEVRVHRCEPDSPELHALYRAADLFVLPTRAECFGYVLVEAMAYGLPVIAGDVGGVGEIVAHDETGWLITPTADDLVDALERAAANADRLVDLGRSGRATAERRFDGAANDELLIDTIVELAASRPRS